LLYGVGAILSAVAVNAFMLLSARTLIGLAVGADSAIATAYIAEFAPRSRRGQLSIIQQWMITVGILVSYLVALVILKVAPKSADGLDWRLILGLGAVPAVIGLALRARMPESPRWLMLHGRFTDTSKGAGAAGDGGSEQRVQAAAEELAQIERERRQKTQWTRGVKRALVVCVFSSSSRSPGGRPDRRRASSSAWPRSSSTAAGARRGRSAAGLGSRTFPALGVPLVRRTDLTVLIDGIRRPAADLGVAPLGAFDRVSLDSGPWIGIQVSVWRRSGSC
jgi:MFS family permease